MKKYGIAAIFLVAVAWAGFQALTVWVNREVQLRIVEKANEVTNDTLVQINEDIKSVKKGTDTLNKGVSDLATATQRGLTGVRREIANAKTITLSDHLPGNIAESLCVQYYKTNSRNALHREGIPDTILQLPPDAFAERCRTAWAKVTWGEVVEWLFPLMEHDGGLQLQIEAGAAYYGPKGKAHE